MGHVRNKPALATCFVDPTRQSRRHFIRMLVGGGALVLLPADLHAANWPHQWQQDGIEFHADFSVSPNSPAVDEVVDLRRIVPATFSLPTSQDTIYVYLFSDRRRYHQYLKKYFPGVPDRRAMYIKQRGYGMVFAFASRDFVVDLRHEFVHGILHSILPFVPLWLDEGLAEYFEMPAAARRDGNPHLHEIRRELTKRHVPKLEPLESLADISEMSAVHYRDAWAWVHFMIHGPPAAQTVLRDYLQDIQRQQLPGPISARLNTHVPHLQNALIRHFAAFEPLP